MGIKNRFYPLLEHITRALLGKIQLKRRNERVPLAIFNDYIGAEVMAYGMFEKNELETLEKILNSETKCAEALDIGANIGNHSLQFSTFLSHVHAFEPHPTTFSLLELNTRGIKNISIYPFGLSDENRQANLSYSTMNFGMARIGENQELGFTVPLHKGDEVISSAIGLIKLDVEGHEPEAIMGLKSIIKKNKPIICFEFHLGITLGEKNTVDILKDLGYKDFYVIHKKYLFRNKNKFSFLKLLLDDFLYGPTYKVKPLDHFDRDFYNMIIAEHKDSKFRIEPEAVIR